MSPTAMSPTAMSPTTGGRAVRFRLDLPDDSLLLRLQFEGLQLIHGLSESLLGAEQLGL